MSSRFVLDTNIFVSALLFKNSNARSTLQKADESGLIMFSDETIAELYRIIIQTKFDKYVSLQYRLTFIQDLMGRCGIIKPTSDFKNCRDPKDNMFLNLAFDAGVSHIISGDKDLLALHPFYSVNIITPAEFLEQANI